MRSRLAASGGLWMLTGAFALSMLWLIVLENQVVAGALFSRALWQEVAQRLGGKPSASDGTAVIDFLPLWIAVTAAATSIWLAGAWVIARRSQRPFSSARSAWGRQIGVWCLAAAGWSVLWVGLLGLDWLPGVRLLLSLFPYWLAVCFAGGVAAILKLATPDRAETERPEDGWHGPVVVGTAIALYVLIFTSMNWLLYRNLLVPHGDSAMYEEHLWNLLHGKGFRSYLDPGSFLGEHIQFVHALLIPLYLLWPSHLLLEFCESLALGLSAAPVYSIALRHTGSRRAAQMLAIAALLYVPLQFLDIAIDQKTFRPNAFGVPLLLLAIDLFERRRLTGSAIACALCLTAQEDYALVLAPLGLWIAIRPHASPGNEPDKGSAAPRSAGLYGGLLCAGTTLYLLLALSVLIPYFREGREAHYASYFSAFGDSPGEILRSLLRQPGFVLGRIFGTQSWLAAVSLLAPLGFLALKSPGRLAVAAPLFCVLSLIRLAGNGGDALEEALIPFHHFHAPLVPIVLWATAAGLAGSESRKRMAERRAGFAWACALATSCLIGISPLGVRFWDFGSLHFWKNNYLQSRRAEVFPRVLAAIPETARVASTDFVHPRFTHFERSYDYSHYRRRVAGWTTNVPTDTDYIVIDTGHRYSEIRQPGDVRELQEHPDEWELLPLDTEGYFIVLKRRTKE